MNFVELQLMKVYVVGLLYFHFHAELASFYFYGSTDILVARVCYESVFSFSCKI